MDVHKQEQKVFPFLSSTNFKRINFIKIKKNLFQKCIRIISFQTYFIKLNINATYIILFMIAKYLIEKSFVNFPLKYLIF